MKKKKENKDQEAKKTTILTSIDKKQELYFSEPIFNPDTDLFEIKQTNQNGDLLDLIVDVSEEEVRKKKDEKIKSFILSQVNNEEKKGFDINKIKDKKPGRKDIASAKDKLITRIIELKLKGTSVYEIVGIISKEGNIKPISAVMFLNEAMEQIKQRSAKEIEEIVEIHLRRYEEIYKWFWENGYIRYAVKTLKIKENLMGVGQDTVLGVTINNYTSEGGQEVEGYDIKSLSLLQRKRLNTLLNKIIEQHKDQNNT